MAKKKATKQFNLYEELAEAFTIFAKYADSKEPGWLGTDYYGIFSGPHPDEISAEDKKRLDELGWSEDGDNRGGWYKFK